MRALVERYSRAHRALGALVRKAVDPEGKTRYVEIGPNLPLASIAQHPRRAPRIDNASWPAGPLRPEQPLHAHPGDECASSAHTMRDTVGISVLGFRGHDLEQVVAEVAADQARNRNFKPVFLTDSPDFSSFVSRGYSFEYVSNFRDYLKPAGSITQAARRDSIAAKWGISRFVDRDDPRRVTRNHPPLAALHAHNAGMSRAVHRDRFAWIIETLRIAISMERFDTAEGMANYLLAFFNHLGKDSVIPAAKVLCRKFIAFGELEALRHFLFKNIAAVKKDDSLFTWFSTYCTGNTEFLPEFATLPSGKPNSYYISKRMAVAGDQALPNLLASGERATPATNLLLANYFATRGDASLYKMFVNRVLGKQGATLLRKVAFGEDNFLQHISFERPPHGADAHDLVSIIMSTHNSAATVHYAARSILAQSYRNIELLICDDESSDGTSSELDKLRSDPRVRLFRSCGNQGTYGVRNSLIPEARGAYITFHDSDDFAFPDRIERQLAFLKREGAAAVAAQWFRVTPRGEFVFSSDQAVARIAVVSLLAPREVFERFGPYRQARFGADTEFYEKLRASLGVDAVRLMQSPVILGLASTTSLTRSPGIEATEDGYRAPARRSYAAAAARSRHMGERPGLPTVEDALAEHGMLMAQARVEEVGGAR
ncbi:glycosyltransferase family 2 protein [Devosia sp. CN2-171]|uniref:glycosyltransferase family 2 protein n=1 Tax=Devosia sp. CN2-171 TaxID=3400909 RepID=UPI003BF85B5E